MFQIYILRIINGNTEELEGKKASVDDITRDQFNVTSIIISLICAILHLILEVIDLYLKSRTSETSFQNYMAACYSARLGWIPQESALYYN